VIVFRHADPRFPFFWGSKEQPSARWNRQNEGPVQYCADTPDGAWAEFLRHEGITSEAELQNVRRALWAIEVPDETEFWSVSLPAETLTGGLASYERCQMEAARLRQNGATALRVPSAALFSGEARGWQVKGGLQAAPPRDGFVLVLFGFQPDLIGWAATISGRPPKNLLDRVRPLT
jgi:hypothetical protein